MVTFRTYYYYYSHQIENKILHRVAQYKCCILHFQGQVLLNVNMLDTLRDIAGIGYTIIWYDI